MKSIVTVLGARPQFIKAAPVSRALAAAGISETIVHTGQHFDEQMSSVFFREMDIPAPRFNLEVNSLSHGAMTGRMLEKVEEVLVQTRPDGVLVYGDTNSTLAGALAAAKLHIPIVHVEAGLRSHDMKMPEEVNRILTDRISHLLSCPTVAAVANLEREGFRTFPCRIEQTGDVMYDAVQYYRQRAMQTSTILERLALKGKSFVLGTIHRAENTNDPARLNAIVMALNEIHREYPVIVPLHPRTRQYLTNCSEKPAFTIIDPAGYFDMLMLTAHCRLVLTDSGGLQKEAYFFSKYCITLRDQTEWVELVSSGANTLAGADSQRILAAYAENKDRVIAYGGLYGDGNAAGRIAGLILES